MNRAVFIKNTIILTGTSFALRAVGMGFRVYLSNKIGAEGMGLYQLTLSVYLLAATLATGGITTAVTRMIADTAGKGGGKREIRAILYRALCASLLFGMLAALLLYYGADFAGAYWLRDARAPLSLMILAPSLPFISVAACYRGYFMARRSAKSPANAQLLEQAVRMALIIALIDRYAHLGIQYTCAIVVLGNTVSEVISCAYMYFAYRRDLRKIKSGACVKSGERRVLRRLFGISMPIALDRYINTALRTVENLLVPNALERYSGSRERALSEIGMLRGMAMPILFFPSSFLSSMSTLLVPEISEAAALGHKNMLDRTIKRALHITITSAILIAGVFAAFSHAFGTIIYNSAEVGFLIGVLAPLTPFMYLESIADGLLKGLNQQVSSLKYSVIDSSLRIAMIIFLVPRFGMMGFLFVMFVSNILIALLNMGRLMKVTGIRFEWSLWVIRPVICAGTAASIAIACARILENTQTVFATVIGIIILCAVYVLLLTLSGCINPKTVTRFLRKKRT